MKDFLLLFAALVVVRPAFAVHDVCDGYGSPLMGVALPAADQTVAGDRRFDRLGESLTALGDFNGDGFPDLAVGAPGDDRGGRGAGAVALLLSDGRPVSLDAEPVWAVGPSPGAHAGFTVAGAGDLDGDGLADLAIGGAPGGRGTVWVLRGRAAAPWFFDLQDADAVIEGLHAGDRFGAAIAALGDVDGDGLGELAVGAPGLAAVGASAGGVLVFRGPVLGALRAVEADAVWLGEETGDEAGRAVLAPGDVDGDGAPDLLVGAPGWGPGLADHGAVYALSGAALARGVHPLREAELRLRGEGWERLGWSLGAAGDVDEDGHVDLWLSARQAQAGKRGSVYLVRGGDLSGGELGVDAAWEARLDGGWVFDRFGTSVAGGGDLDGDGALDVVVGAEAPWDADAGAVVVVRGPFSGQRRVDPTEGRFVGGSALARAGRAVAVLPDLNGDGFDDWLAGAPGETVGSRSQAGRVGLFFGGHDLEDWRVWHRDADGDGWGSDVEFVEGCRPPPGYIGRGGDCDDSSARWHPYAIERDCADRNDYSCDGSVGHVDRDEDGHEACEGDCADQNNDVHPARDEACFDGIDNDCDAQIDDPSAADAQDWRPDVDMDGYGDAALVYRACVAPGFFLAPPVVRGGDCDDLEAEVHPGLAERCDEVDNDCDGEVDEDAVDARDWFRDADGDGFGLRADHVRTCAAPEGYLADPWDCDDRVALVHPGAVERCDFVDDDCSGQLYRGGHLTADHATWWVQGPTTNYRLGNAVARVPDADGDGIDELAATAPGDITGSSVYVGRFDMVSGGYDWAKDYGGGIHAWSLRVFQRHYHDELGYALAGGDFDGDGFGDVAIGAPGTNVHGLQDAGAVYVFYGPFDGRDVSAAHADARLLGSHGIDRVGHTLTAGDLDGDGDWELLVGAIGLDEGMDSGEGAELADPQSRRGGVYIVQGDPDRGAWQDRPLDHEARMLGVEARDQLGRSITVIGDTDGDGLVEVAVGAPRARLSRGYVAIYEPAPGQESGVVRAQAVIRDARVESQVGYAAASGDVDGDGLPDLIVSNAQSDIWVVKGDGGGWPTAEVHDLGAVLLQGPVNQELGNALTVGDVNGDGVDDVVVGAPTDDEGGFHAGAIYVLYGGQALPPVVDLDAMESFGRVDYGTTSPVYSAQNICGVEGAKLLGPGARAEFGYALMAGFRSGIGPHGDVVGGAPGWNGQMGGVVGWVTGRYGTDWEAEEGEALVASKIEWWPDLDLDGEPDRGGPSMWSCPMHVPVSCDDPSRPVWVTGGSSDHDPDPPVDTSPDPDPPVDTGADPPVDTSADPPVDTSPDVPVDTSPDAPLDTALPGEPALGLLVLASRDATCGDGDDLPVVALPPGAPGWLCVTITNVGDRRVVDIAVVADTASVPGSWSLAPGASVTVASAPLVIAADLTEGAQAVGRHAGAVVTSPRGEAGFDVRASSLVVSQAVALDGDCADGDDAPHVVARRLTAYRRCLRLENTGETTLFGVQSTDPGAAGPWTLAPGAWALVPIDGVATGEEAWSVGGEAVDELGEPVHAAPAAASLDVISPQLQVSTTVSLDGACPGLEAASTTAGAAVLWCYAVTNTGDAALVDVVVEDGVTALPVGALAPGATATVSRADVAAEDVVVLAEAGGVDLPTGGYHLSPPDGAALDVVRPEVEVSVGFSTSGTCPGFEEVHVRTGAVVTLCLRVANTGDTILADLDLWAEVAAAGLRVDLDLGLGVIVGGTPGATLGSLLPGFEIVVALQVAVLVDMEVRTQVGGRDVALDIDVDSDLAVAIADVVHPSVLLDTTASLDGSCPGSDLALVEYGRQITWCHSVTNDGDTTLTDLVLVDEGGNTITLPPLAPGETTVVGSGTSTVMGAAQADAWVEGFDQFSLAVWAEDTLSVLSLPGQADLALQVSAPASIRRLVSPLIRYDVVVRSEGQIAAGGAVVTVPIPAGAVFVSAVGSGGACTNLLALVTCPLGELEVGEEGAATIVVSSVGALVPVLATFTTTTTSLEVDLTDNVVGVTTTVGL